MFEPIFLLDFCLDFLLLSHLFTKQGAENQNNRRIFFGLFFLSDFFQHVTHFLSPFLLISFQNKSWIRKKVFYIYTQQLIKPPDLFLWYGIKKKGVIFSNFWLPLFSPIIYWFPLITSRCKFTTITFFPLEENNQLTFPQLNFRYVSLFITCYIYCCMYNGLIAIYY